MILVPCYYKISNKIQNYINIDCLKNTFRYLKELVREAEFREKKKCNAKKVTKRPNIPNLGLTNL